MNQTAEIVYSQTIFLMIEPPSRIVSVCRINCRKEHDDLILKAKQKKLCLYRANVISNGDKHYAVQPWLIEWDTVTCKSDIQQKQPDKQFEKQPRKQPEKLEDRQQDDDSVMESMAELKCPFCDKKVTSTPGRTLHVKNKHPERYQEYMRSIYG